MSAPCFCPWVTSKLLLVNRYIRIFVRKNALRFNKIRLLAYLNTLKKRADAVQWFSDECLHLWHATATLSFLSPNNIFITNIHFGQIYVIDLENLVKYITSCSNLYHLKVFLNEFTSMKTVKPMRHATGYCVWKN